MHIIDIQENVGFETFSIVYLNRISIFLCLTLGYLGFRKVYGDFRGFYLCPLVFWIKIKAHFFSKISTLNSKRFNLVQFFKSAVFEYCRDLIFCVIARLADFKARYSFWKVAQIEFFTLYNWCYRCKIDDTREIWSIENCQIHNNCTQLKKIALQSIFSYVWAMLLLH